MAITTLSSPLISSANKIVAINSKSKPSLVRAQTEYKKFGNFIETKSKEIERISLPDNKKIQKLANINVVNTFGSAGGLLKGLLGGGLDLGGLVSGFFPGENTKVGTSSKIGAPKIKPILKSGKLRLGGIRALGVANALFAGLDFATGLAEGESVGKSAAGTSGSLAGTLLGGAIGQALIPIPGLGFVIGSAAGSFLGGYGADRAYETIASQRELKARQEAKLKEQSQSLKKGGNVENQDNILDKFGGIVDKFEGFVKGIVGGIFGSLISGDSNKTTNEYGQYGNRDPGANNNPGDLQDMQASGGKLPSSYPITGVFGEQRPGHKHKGTDYAAPINTPISVIQPGKVTRAGNFNDGYGNSIQIDHPGGINSFYAHLNSINVKSGQSIEPGTVIGRVGNTGHSFGAHLHFEVDSNGSLTNSAPYADKLFRFGRNVKVKTKAGGQTTPSGISGATNIELHASQPGGGTGLIGSYIDKPNAVTLALEGKYGKYGKDFRDGNLGGPKRGLNLLETTSFDKKNTDLITNPKTRQAFIQAQAQKLIKALPTNAPINIFAGHNDVTTGETGTSGISNSTINGKTIEQYYNDALAKEVERLAKAAGMTNIRYIRSIIANDDKDPNTNWARSAKLRNSTSALPQNVTTPPPKKQDVSYNQSPYLQNQKTLIVNRPSTVIAAGGGGGGGGLSKPTVVPVSSGGGGTVVVVASNLNSILDYKLATT